MFAHPVANLSEVHRANIDVLNKFMYDGGVINGWKLTRWYLTGDGGDLNG